jgi:antitoxin (DNA-binding transcriptional repressor) of toxin-antitoxin stability system
MLVIDIEDVLADFDRLIEEAAQGESFAIAVEGAPLVKVEAVPREMAEYAESGTV